MDFFERHSGELLILSLFIVTVATLIVLVPTLVRAHLRKTELIHQEHMNALEKGAPVPLDDDRSRVAGRLALLVPMVSVICAGTVTCFMAAKSTDNLFTVTLAVWVVAGIVSLAAITGGVSLIARLAQLQNGEKDEEEVSDHPLPP